MSKQAVARGACPAAAAQTCITGASLLRRAQVFNTVPFRLLHEWSDVTVDGKAALAARSTMYVGIQPPIDSSWSKVVNPFAFK